LIRGGGLVSRLAAAEGGGGFALEQVGDSPHEGLQRLRDFQMTEIRVSPCGG